MKYIILLLLIVGCSEKEPEKVEPIIPKVGECFYSPVYYYSKVIEVGNNSVYYKYRSRLDQKYSKSEDLKPFDEFHNMYQKIDCLGPLKEF